MRSNHTTDPTGYGLAARPSPAAFDDAPLFAPPAAPAPSDRKTHGQQSVGFPSPTTGHPLPRAVEVAARVSDGRKQRILQFLANNGPVTIHEFCQACTSGSVVVLPHQVSGRFTDMAKKLWIAPIGERKSPLSPAACTVWEITPAGRDELARMKTRPGSPGKTHGQQSVGFTQRAINPQQETA